MRTTVHEARGRYAGAIAAAPGVDDPRVIEAFAAVPRERFVGPGPWLFLGRDGYIQSASADPALDTIHPGYQIAISWDEAAPLLLDHVPAERPASESEKEGAS